LEVNYFDRNEFLWAKRNAIWGEDYRYQNFKTLIKIFIPVSNQQQTSTNADICRHNATLAHAQAIAAESAHIAAVQQQLMDPGRIILNAPPKPPEPVFTAPSKSIHVQRVVHSETYLKYIFIQF
jgi:hypothetical protein